MLDAYEQGKEGTIDFVYEVVNPYCRLSGRTSSWGRCCVVSIVLG
jgi:hypothetical protein